MLKLYHNHDGKMVLEVIEWDCESAYAGKHTSFEIDVCPTGPSGNRSSRAALNRSNGDVRDSKLRQQDLQSMHAKDAGGLMSDQKWRKKNKIWSDVSPPVNCRCEVCVLSSNDHARNCFLLQELPICGLDASFKRRAFDGEH